MAFFYTVSYQKYHSQWRGTRWQHETFEDALEEANHIARTLIDDTLYVRFEILKHKGIGNNVKPK